MQFGLQFHFHSYKSRSRRKGFLWFILLLSFCCLVVRGDKMDLKIRSPWTNCQRLLAQMFRVKFLWKKPHSSFSTTSIYLLNVSWKNIINRWLLMKQEKKYFLHLHLCRHNNWKNWRIFHSKNTLLCMFQKGTLLNCVHCSKCVWNITNRDPHQCYSNMPLLLFFVH